MNDAKGRRGARVGDVIQSVGCRVGGVAAFVLGSAVATIGVGCAKSEHSAYMRHLTTVIEPSREIPEEVVLTFDLDRDAPSGAVARGEER